MGLFRKTLAVSTLGTVNGSSKKQRTAKATQRAAQTTAAASVMQARILAELSGSVAARRAALMLELQAQPSTLAGSREVRRISRELAALR